MTFPNRAVLATANPHGQLPPHHQEELIRPLVDVPGKLPLPLRDLHVQVIHLPINLDGYPLGDTTACFLNLQAVALLFRPNKRLGPVNPGSAQLHMEAVHLLEPGTTTQAIAVLKQQHIEATVFEIAGRRNPSETTTNDNNIN